MLIQIDKSGDYKMQVFPAQMSPGETCANDMWDGSYQFWIKTDRGTLVSLKDGSTYEYSGKETDFYRVSIEEAVAKI